MNKPETLPIRDQLEALLARQIAASREDGLPPAAVRIDRMRRLESVLRDHQKAWCEALDADFAGRPVIQSRMEIFSTIASLQHACKHVHAWMKPERRSLPLIQRLTGARAEVFYQPLGVVGVVAPWNFPLVLSIGALASVFAAGNRAMLKPSELAPHSSALMKELLDRAFAPDELATVLGGPEVGQAFTHLAFDHLLFTGAPGVARHVMRAAAEHLVPVTLELGGKCPVIVGPEADWDLAVDRILWGKIQNAGQICLAPDYVFVPKGREAEFVERARAKIAAWYPRLKNNPDYCSIISPRHFERLKGYIDQAVRSDVKVEVLDPAGDDFGDQRGRRMAPAIFIEPGEDLDIMRDEVFGPLLSLRTYTDLDAVIRFINARPRPLALYYFGSDRNSIDKLKAHTVSGGITVNDIASHAAADTLPLGGVGNSGMGRYHGRDGFVSFSHPKAVLTQRKVSLGRLFNPPYSGKKTRMLDRGIGKPMG